MTESSASLPICQTLTRENKPWTRWWWLGSAVDEAGITRELEDMARAGIGGVEITAIYGVQGQENRDVPYLSTRWLELLAHACKEARRLGMGVDLPPGSGWRCGGPHTTDANAAIRFALKETGADGNKKQVFEPEIGFERTKRAGPGGAGRVIDMFDHEAVATYMGRITAAVSAAIPNGSIRAQFHDSWEYEAGWSRKLPEFFKERRGYDLMSYLAALSDELAPPLDGDTARRVRYDYRLTLEEMLLENFSANWGSICHSTGMLTRNQAHGSPGNLLDIYAAADIPETEIYRDKVSPFINMFASSAGHVAGKKLISSESFTWLSNHFQSDLGKIKRYADFLFLSGINHIFFHGTAYSSVDAKWPGWLFYASTQVNSRNPIWRDLPALNAYIGRCQSLLQAGKPDNDVLLYWPLADIFMDTPGRHIKFHIDGDKWTAGPELENAAKSLWNAGYLFDYVSDRQLQKCTADGNTLVTEGKTRYRAVVVPKCTFIPSETAERLASLGTSGIPIIYQDDTGPVWDVPGLGNLEERRKHLHTALTALLGSATFKATPHLPQALKEAGITPEPIQEDAGLRCVRRKLEDGSPAYLVVNRGNTPFDAIVTVGKNIPFPMLFDPWTGRKGRPSTHLNGTLRLQLEPDEAVCILNRQTDDRDTSDTRWVYRDGIAEETCNINGAWTLESVSGGPVLPPSQSLEKLVSITDLGDPEFCRFAGTIRYTTTFSAAKRSKTGEYLLLDLGVVKGSARAFLNGTELGVTVAAPHHFILPASCLREINVLTVEVTTLATNRIRDLDRRGVKWRIFHDINFIRLGGGPFDASDWPVDEWGLLGPVTITPIG